MVRIKKICKIILISLFLVFINTNYTQVAARNSQDIKKVVFLTFDDGPSSGITKEILNVLDTNNIKASFFIVGEKAKMYPEIIKVLDIRGMSVMPHTFKHDYNTIYSNKESYFNDLNECDTIIKGIINKSESRFIRMPGGSDNTYGEEVVLSEIKKSILTQGRNYIDWSLSIGDTEKGVVSIDEINSRLREYGGLYKVEVILLHDLAGKQSTVKSLQDIIDFYKEKGYQFKTLDQIEEWEVDYLKKIKVLNK